MNLKEKKQIQEKFKKANKDIESNVEAFKYDDVDDCLFMTFKDTKPSKKSYLIPIDDSAYIRVHPGNLKVQAIIIEDFMTFYAKKNPDFIKLYKEIETSKRNAKKRTIWEEIITKNVLYDFYKKDSALMVSECCV